MKTKKVVFVEPSSSHLHVYSRLTIPRLGSVLLGTIMRDRGWDVKVYIEDIAQVDMTEVLSADIIGISTPIVERTAKGREDLSQRLGAVTAAIQSSLDKWPRVIPLPVNFEQGPVFEPFARIGLLFTENLDRIRQVYTRAGEILELWEDSPAATQPAVVETSKR
jgi:hypothetical protein